MEKPIFGELDSRLSVVQRWNLLQTIQTQTVAEHAFNVTRIAERIAADWFNIGAEGLLMTRILQYAHHHDDFEALTLDIPTMAKPYFDEAAFEAEHSDLIQIPKPPALVKAVVKLADLLEGWHFLCVEVQLGNSYALNHFDHEPGRILAWFEDTFKGTPLNDCDEWYDRTRIKLCRTLEEMRSERSSRFSRRGA